MSQITTIPGSETPQEIQAAAAPFRRTRRAPAFRPEILRSLRMHPLVAAVVGLTVLLVALGYGLSMKPVYEAESRIYIEPAISSPLSDPSAGGLFDSVRYDSYLQQQMQTATRVDILEAAIKSLPAGTWAQPGETLESAAHRLSAALKVARVTTSYQMSIALTGPNAKKTADTVNAVTTAYLDAGRRDELSHSTSRAQILTEERDRISRELTAARAEQAALGNALGQASPGTAVANPYDDQLTALRGELVSARQAHDAAAAQLTSVAGGNATAASGLDALATEIAAGDSSLSTLKSSVTQRRAQLIAQMSGLTPANNLYKIDQDELADLDKVLASMQTQLRDQAARRIEDKLRTELARTGDMEARIDGELARGTAAATSAAPKLQRSQELTANITRLTGRFATIDDALRTLELETHGMPMAHLSLAAAVPAAPEASRRKLVLLAALPLALFAACFAAGLLHRRERRVFIAQDMEDLLGFTPIAVLPARADVSEAVLGEYVLRLAGGIENAYRTRAARVFVLTPVSAKTSVEALTAMLSAKLTALGLMVRVVDASELLDGAARPSAIMSNAMKLAGQHEGRMASALERLKMTHDLIFIAAPALLVSAEAEYVARAADATILVAECGVASKQELTEAALLLENLQVTGVGTVLDELKLRYADPAFRNAVMSVEARLKHVELPRTVTDGARQTSSPVEAAAPVEPVVVAAEPALVPAVAEPEVVTTQPVAADVEVKPMAAAEPTPVPSEVAVRHPVFASVVEPVTPLDVTEVAAEPVWPAVYAAHPQPFHEEEFTPAYEPMTERAEHVDALAAHADVLAAHPVWPETRSHLEPNATVLAFEQELLSARGTSVFLTPRAGSDRAIERLEPLGTQDSLAPAAEMLAASFGALPMYIEPSPAETLYPEGTTSAEAEAIRIARANRAALEKGRSLEPGAEPLQMDEIRRLLNPVKAETTIETRNGKDMIGARAVTAAARQTQLAGWTPDGDAGMSAKKNWFQKLFQRDQEPEFSIVPSEKEEDEAGNEAAFTSSRANSMYDLPMGQPAFSNGNGSAVAVAEPMVEAAAAMHMEDSARGSNGSFRPVARVVSLLTPVEEPVAAEPPPPLHVAADAPIAAELRVAAPVSAMPVGTVASPVKPTSAAPVVVAPVVARSAAVNVPTLPPPSARRPKSFLQLTQARRRPMLDALVAERAIAVAATPSMLQEPEPAVSEEPIEIPVLAEPVSAPAEEQLSEEPAQSVAAVDQHFEEISATSQPVPADLNQADEIEPLSEPQPTAEPQLVAEPAYQAPEPVRLSPAQWPMSSTPVRDGRMQQPVAPARMTQARPFEQRMTEQRMTEQHEEPRLQTRSESRSTSLDPALSRRWGLLSRYQQTDRAQTDAAQDDSRRGRE